MDYLQYYNNKYRRLLTKRFKPYYKWITFNIPEEVFYSKAGIIVLNLIINGLPSILMLNHQII